MSSNSVPPSVFPKVGHPPSGVWLPLKEQATSYEPSDPAKLLVEVAVTMPDVSGVRLWRMVDGRPIAWQQKGAVPAASDSPGDMFSLDIDTARPDGSPWTIPLSGSEKIFGYLEIFGRNLSGATRPTLEKLATLAAAALGQEEDQQKAKSLSAVLESTKLLNSTLDLPELLDIILQLSTRLCEADRGTVFLVDRQRNEIWSLKGLGLEKREIRLPIGRGIAGWVAREGNPVRVEDASADPRFDPEVDRDFKYRTRELIALPIRNKEGEIVGVLEVLNRPAGPFSAANESALSHLCVYVAVALEKAQLHNAILVKQRMENDLKLAREVQKGLLPEEPPEIAGFEISVAYTPSLMVGGDYYDFMKLRPASLLGVIADVEGKGVASALLMASLQASLRTVSAHVHALENVVKSVNDMVLSHVRTHKLLSLFVAVIDERNRALHYINAGHVPPIVVRRDGEITRLDEGGLVLGVFRDALYKRGRVELRPGDIFAAYTDGVTEAMDTRGEQYGLERLADLIGRQRNERAGEIVKTVLSEVDRFSREGPNEDDRVMLILKAN